MTRRNRKPPQPVDGKIVKRPGGKTLGQVLVYALGFLVGVGLLGAWWTDALAVIGRQVTLGGLALGLFLALGGPAAIALALWQELGGERLVLARDRLQVVRARGGEDVVVVQIPYGNIEQTEYDAAPQGKRVTLELKDLDDPDTYHEGAGFRAFEEMGDWHYTIDAGYEMTPKAIYRFIQDRLQAPPKKSSRPQRQRGRADD
jgi:hypothetical protein